MHIVIGIIEFKDKLSQEDLDKLKLVTEFKAEVTKKGNGGHKTKKKYRIEIHSRGRLLDGTVIQDT